MKPNPIHKIKNGWDFTRHTDKYFIKPRTVWAVVCPYCPYEWNKTSYVSQVTRKQAADKFREHMKEAHLTVSKGQITV